jgi:hypothetical protein
MAEGKGWSTRAGGPSKPVPKPPESADLAAMMPSTGSQTRERAANAQARLEEARKKQEDMARRAARARRNEQMRTIMRSRVLMATVVGVLCITLFASLVLPRISAALHPPLSQQQLEQEMPVIKLRATKVLSADLGTPSISSPDARTFQVKFIARRGEKMLSGRRITKGCSVAFTIDRETSSPGALNVKDGPATVCKPSR